MASKSHNLFGVFWQYYAINTVICKNKEKKLAVRAHMPKIRARVIFFSLQQWPQAPNLVATRLPSSMKFLCSMRILPRLLIKQT